MEVQILGLSLMCLAWIDKTKKLDIFQLYTSSKRDYLLISRLWMRWILIYHFICAYAGCLFALDCMSNGF